MQAEELIKQEMICMMQYDTLMNPVIPNHKRAQTIISQAHNYLDQHPYEEVSKEEFETVCSNFLSFATLYM